MNRAVRSRQTRGYSLVEATVVLALTTVVGWVAWQVQPRMRAVDEAQVGARQMASARAAVEGFALRQHRLPCPDTAVARTGREDCAAGASVGGLPWRDLGLDAGMGRDLRYGVYRVPQASLPADTDLARALARYTPSLPAPYVSNVVNGLDLCWALRIAGGRAGQAGALTAGGVEVAYALAHPGADGQFQGLNTTGFDSPLRPVSASAYAYDDTVVALGLFELAGQLGCARNLGQAQASARSAAAANDMARNAAFQVDFRTFSREVRQTDVAFAAANLGLATLDLVNATATSITAVAIAANSAGVGAGVVIPAVLAVGATAAALVAATAGTVSAALALVKANKQEAEAIRLRTEANTLLAVSAAEAIANDQKGLRP